jgi:hypothetical protein
MKTLLTALILLLPLAAQAASPEDAYLAARDKAIARIKPKNDKIDDTVTKADDAALAQLQKQLEKLIGPTTIAGISGRGKINLETLIEGEMGFGQLDGLVYQSGDEKTRVIVTTTPLLKRWIAAHKKWWDDNNIPQEMNAALKSEPFYTQAMSSDAAVWHYADVPVATSANATFVTAMLDARRQDIGLTTPTELLVAVAGPVRAFIWSAPVNQKITMMPECAAVWDAAQKKADDAYEAYRASDLKDEKKFEDSKTILDNADAGYRKCFAARVKDTPFFAEITKQAQELVDRMR